MKALHLEGGAAACVLRRHAASRRWSVTIEGFEFWQHVRIMGRDMWAIPVGFDDIRSAKSFAEKVMLQAGARMASSKTVDKPRHFRTSRSDECRNIGDLQ